MNSLSWLLYFIGLVNNLGRTLGAGCVILLIVSGITGIIGAIAATESGKFPELARVWLRRLVPAFIICAFLLTVVPSQRTMIMIAASEVGERVIKNEQVAGIANDSMDLLRSFITKETLKVKDEIEAIRRGEKKT